MSASCEYCGQLAQYGHNSYCPIEKGYDRGFEAGRREGLEEAAIMVEAEANKTASGTTDRERGWHACAEWMVRQYRFRAVVLAREG